MESPRFPAARTPSFSTFVSSPPRRTSFHGPTGRGCSSLFFVAICLLWIQGSQAPDPAQEVAPMEELEDRCFQVVYPSGSDPHELSEDEYDELHVLFRINCDHTTEFADLLEISTDGNRLVKIPLDEWHTEMYQFELFKPARGASNLEASLYRPSGVGPFYKVAIDEDPMQVYHYGGLRTFLLEEMVEGPELDEPIIRVMEKVNLAYLDASLPDGPYTLTLTVLDTNSRRYSSASISISKDSVNEYNTNVTGADLTSCPEVRGASKGAEDECSSRCLRGTCRKGACLCEADWFGEFCDKDLHDDSIYLPDTNPAATQWSCHQANHFRKGCETLNEMLRETQFSQGGASCKERGGLQAFHADTVSAFGINLRSLAIALGRSLQSGRPLTVGFPWSCLQHERCPEGRYTCYFQHLANCPEDGEIPSCGWKDDNQELDLARPAIGADFLDQISAPETFHPVISENSSVVSDALVFIDTKVADPNGQLRNFGTMSGASLKLLGGTRWLKHPMGTIKVLDLSRGQISFGEYITLSQHYTVFVWLEWKPSDVAARSVAKTSGGAAIAVQEGHRRLGIYTMGNKSHEAEFLPCGYEITVVGWQLVMAVGTMSLDGTAVSRFFVNNHYVGESQGNQANQKLMGFGYASQGPGFLSMAGVWDRVLDERERTSLWESTRGYFGLQDGFVSTKQRGGGVLKGQRNHTVAMTSTPPEFKIKGTQWWMSHALQFVMRPNEDLQRLLRQAKRAVRFRENMLGVHVRHGEACDVVNNRKCFQADEILPAIRTMVDKYKLSGVYVATDSPSILDRFRESEPSIDWTSLEAFDRNQLNSGWTQMLMTRIGRIDRRVVAESSFIDIFLLSETEAMVGQFSSAFFRTAFALSVAEKGYVPPYTGLDGPPSW